MTSRTDTTIPAEIAAIWGAFLYEGLMLAEYKLGDERTLLDHWHSGYLELVTELAKVLPPLWEQARREPDFQAHHAGVFEYEVVAPLGQYLGEYLTSHEGQLPPASETEAAIKHLVLSFFAQQHLPLV